ncbi:AAA family ATPase [Mycobacterium sp. URHB0021]
MTIRDSSKDWGPLEGGDATNFGFAITGIRIGDGNLIELPGAGSVIAIVGANNVGKSTLLEQIYKRLSTNKLQEPLTPVVVTELSEPWSGSLADLRAWLVINGQIDETNGPPHVRRSGAINRMPLDNAAETRKLSGPGGLAPWFISNQSPMNRISNCDPMGRLDDPDATPQHPSQILYGDLAKREKVQRFAERMFDIVLHFDAVSTNVGFRVGDPAVEPPRVNVVDKHYTRAVQKLPRLADQGDGIKSALGVIIPLITNEYPLTLIDEPEAFLHPPQAKLIGSEMGSLAKANRAQIIVATHDKNVLQGLVESDAPLSIIHLNRVENTTTAKHLAAEDITQLWRDATLRYGDALNGLFHRAVVVTENDRDSRFYAAAIDSAQEAATPRPPAHNLMFLGSNGKQNIAPIADRLIKLGVRTVGCPDLDILNNEARIRTLVEAHGGIWDHIEGLYRRATSEFMGTPRPLRVERVKRKIAEVFSRTEDTEIVTEDLAARLADAVKIPKTKWSELKEYGDRAFRSDPAAASALLDALDDLGIVVVRVGELERFAKRVKAPKGPEFLPVALREKVHETQEARQHAQRLLKAAGIPIEPDSPL